MIHGIEADAKATHLLRTILGAGAESTKIHEVLLRGEQRLSGLSINFLFSQRSSLQSSALSGIGS